MRTNGLDRLPTIRDFEHFHAEIAQYPSQDISIDFRVVGDQGLDVVAIGKVSDMLPLKQLRDGVGSGRGKWKGKEEAASVPQRGLNS